MRGKYSDLARTGSSSSSPVSTFSTGESEEESTETVKSKPAKSFLKNFVDKIPDPVKDSVSEQFGGMMGMVEK
jgi:hypothetical protein